MPNWCQNELTVTNATPRFRRWLETHGFSFAKMSPPRKPKHPVPEGWQQSDRQCAAWGTKWDLDDADQADVAEALLDEGCAFFDTAWSPPLEAIQALSQKFPEVSFKLHYCELGMFFAGTATFQDGHLDDQMHEDKPGVMHIATSIFGMEDEEETEVSCELIEVG